MAVRGRPTLTGPESIFNNKHRREASTTELLAMGSTCSTLDGVDAPRSRASQIEQEQREKEAAHKIAEAEHKPVWKSKLYGAFVLNRRVVSTPSTRRCSMAWRCRFLAARPSQVGRVIAEK